MVAFSVVFFWSAVFFFRPAAANDTSVSKYLGELKAVGDMVRHARYDEALAAIDNIKDQIDPDDPIDGMYLVYFDNQEGVSYARMGDLCSAEKSFRSAYNGAQTRLSHSPGVIANNIVSLANVYIAMNDRKKEAEIVKDIQDMLVSKVRLPTITMLALIKSLTTLYVDVGDLDRAENSVDGIVEALRIKGIRNGYYDYVVASTVAEIFHRRGRLLDAMKKYDDAFQQLQRSESNKVDISVDLANYSRLHASLGDVNGAEASLMAAEEVVKRFRRDANQALAGIRYRSKEVLISNEPQLVSSGATECP